MFPLLGAISHAPIFGWAKPTPVDMSRLRNPVRDNVYIAAAGPASNFLAATAVLILLLALRVLSPTANQILTGYGGMEAGGTVLMPIVLLLHSLMMVNVILGVFNLIPIPPLDGGHILEGLLPARARASFAPVKEYGFFLLFFLLWSGGVSTVLSPFLRFFNSLLRI